MRLRSATTLLLIAAACSSPAPRVSSERRGAPPPMNEFVRYIALGDSISIDAYPARDVERRHRGRASTTELGAVSLLYRNDDKLWPEFRGRDLRTIFPTLEFRSGSGWLSRSASDDLTSDGATTRTLIEQVRRVTSSDEPTLITVTAGGNDLLGEIGFRGSPADSLQGDPVAPIVERLRQSVRKLLELRPNSLILIGTVYDPSDGTNRLPGYSGTLNREADWLRRYNDAIRDLAASDPRLRLADIHAHFLGHGLSVAEADRWYLAESIIEPNARGASEVRRVWLEAIGR